MGRPRLEGEQVDLSIERRRNYQRERYFRTREELERGNATQAVVEMTELYHLQLTPEQIQGMADYIRLHFKKKLYKTEEM